MNVFALSLWGKLSWGLTYFDEFILMTLPAALHRLQILFIVEKSNKLTLAITRKDHRRMSLHIYLLEIIVLHHALFKKDNPRLNGSECCNMSLQKEFKICLSEVYQTTQNLTPLHYKTPLLHSKNPQNKLELSEDLTIAPP